MVKPGAARRVQHRQLPPFPLRSAGRQGRSDRLRAASLREQRQTARAQPGVGPELGQHHADPGAGEQAPAAHRRGRCGDDAPHHAGGGQRAASENVIAGCWAWLGPPPGCCRVRLVWQSARCGRLVQIDATRHAARSPFQQIRPTLRQQLRRTAARPRGECLCHRTKSVAAA